MVGVGNGQRPAAQPALGGSWIGDREVQFRRKRQMRLPAAAESESRLGVEKRGALDCSGRRGFPEKIRDHESQRLRAIPGEFPPQGPERSTLRPLDQPTVFLEGQIPLREGGCREEEAGAAKKETPSRPLGPGHPARLPHRQLDHSHPVPGGRALAGAQLEEQTRAATPRPSRIPAEFSRTASVRGVSSRGQFAGSVRGVSSRGQFAGILSRISTFSGKRPVSYLE